MKYNQAVFDKIIKKFPSSPKSQLHFCFIMQALEDMSSETLDKLNSIEARLIRLEAANEPSS